MSANEGLDEPHVESGQSLRTAESAKWKEDYLHRDQTERGEKFRGAMTTSDETEVLHGILADKIKELESKVNVRQGQFDRIKGSVSRDSAHTTNEQQ